MDRYHVLVSGDGDGFGNRGHTSVVIESNGNLHVWFQDAECSTILTAAGAMAAGETHHLALTFGDGDARLDLDGRDAAVAVGCDVDWQHNAENLLIGAGSHLRSEETPKWRTLPFNGRIEDEVVFNAALDAQQVEDLAGGTDTALLT